MTENKYINQIQSIENLSFQKIIDIAQQGLPFEKRAKPWSFINHGVGLLHKEDDLNCYLAAYGIMHEEKIRIALSSINNPQQVFSNDLAIIDWGCGQGLATVCLFDFFKENNILLNNIQRVILIEPSLKAITRAKVNVNAYLKDETKITTVNKYLNDVNESDILNTQSITLHFFSNILDIDSVDLEKLAELVEENIDGEHYFFCVGPLNTESTRIEEFAKNFNIPQGQVIKKSHGKLKRTRGTIKLLVFKIKGKEIEIIKTDFYPPVPNNTNYISMIEKILRNVNPLGLNPMDRIIQFYKTVVELEQQKEPQINTFYKYRINDINNDIISFDLQDDKDFLQEFKRNSNEKLTKWPKDLFIGINARLNDKLYTLLHYIIPYNDIKDIDVNTQRITVQISNFEVNLRSFEELELSKEKISELEKEIKQKKTIEGIFNILNETVDGITLENNILCLALSSKNSSLSQIYSELNKIRTKNIQQGTLLESFLMHKKIDNQINNLKEEDLIQISNLDDSQKKAVLNAFNNKLSVITGPPGSGKTQVILNILANAVLQNKKVLVASKINKAVDNVKERFDKIDDTGYFLRFGKRDILSENTIPAIERITNIHAGLEDNSQTVSNLKKQLNTHRKILKENNAKFTNRNKLQNTDIPRINKQIIILKQKIESLKSENNLLDSFLEIDIQILDSFNSTLKIQRNSIELEYSGLKKLWFNWFNKKKYAQIILNTIEQYPFEIKKYIQNQHLKSRVSDFHNGGDIIKLYSQLIDIFSKAINYINDYNKFKTNYDTLVSELAKCDRIVKEITKNEQHIKSIIENSKQEIIKLGKPLLVGLINYKIKNANIPSINNFKDYLPYNIPWKYEEIDSFINTTKSFLDIFNIVSVTSLSVKAALPLENELFDMVVIDEASQCDIASAIPLIFRTKQLVIIGDPLQLKHISKINNYEEVFIKEKLLINNSAYLQYNNKSLWDYSKDLLSLTTPPTNVPVMIDSHYRCHPRIIGYSNEAFYTKHLAKKLSIYTKDEQFQFHPKGIIWIDVQGEQKANNINVNMAEISKSIKLATNLAIEHKSITIGIITPFRNQAEQLNKEIPNEFRDRIIADTVYKFQGDEKDIIIYSLVVTDNSPSSKIYWIDNTDPNLINVAVTRAKNTLYIVGNKQYIKNNSSVTKPLGKLVQYVERTQNN